MIPPRHTPDAVLRIRARMYRSRYPALRTVRIAGDGSVWVDGTRRSFWFDHARQHLRYPRSIAATMRGWPMTSLALHADAMEVVK